MKNVPVDVTTMNKIKKSINMAYVWIFFKIEEMQNKIKRYLRGAK